jgi:hypothetical protein
MRASTSPFGRYQSALILAPVAVAQDYAAMENLDQAMTAAQAQAAHPGDESLTCDQLFRKRSQRPGPIRRCSRRWRPTLPRDTAHRVAGLAVEEMAKVLARGARVVSRDEAEALQEQAAQQRQSEEAKRQLEWQAEFERSTRWNWLGSLLGFVVTAVVARLLLYPLLRPLLESWFN